MADNPGLLSNLPAQVSSFIGREAELAAVRGLVAGSRLVTLTGAGGAGKTRLGLQVAAGLADGTGDGVWFADLAPLSDPDLVAVTVADVLGVRQEPGRPVLDTLVEAVGGRSLLVLLDNCEHLIGACAKLAEALLRGCPNLALLATSREPLGIGGEHVFRVPSLGVPADGDDAGAIRACEAVRLLADRAAAQGVPLAWDEETAAVAGRICRRLDGIPLAIELAAARLRVMPAGELEARLDERFALLTGGSRAGAAAAADAAGDGGLVLGAADRRRAGGAGPAVGLRRGVRPGRGRGGRRGPGRARRGGAWGIWARWWTRAWSSSATPGPGRAGTGCWRPSGSTRPGSWTRWARRRPRPPGSPTAITTWRWPRRPPRSSMAPDQAAWLDRLDAELGNLRAAIAFSLTQPDPEPGLRLAASLRVYWRARGHAAEGADALRALLDVPAAQEATLPRARALAAAAHLLQQTGGYAIAEDYCQEALAIARAAGDDYLVADAAAHTRLASCCARGSPAPRCRSSSQGLGLARRLGEPHLTARLLSARAYATNVEGDHAGAARDAAEALRLFRQAGDRLRVGQMLGNLGYYELSAGDLDAARRHLAESLDIARALNDRYSIRLRDLQPWPGRVPRRLAGRRRGPVRRITRPGPAHGDEAAYRLCADRPGPGRPRRGRPGLVRPAARRGRPGPGGPGPRPPAAGSPAGRP